MTTAAAPVGATATFDGARVMITGGMGFLGSNLAIALIERGAQVTIVDAMIPGYGGNLFNIHPIRDRVTVNYSDIRDANVMNHLVRGQDFVFHLAGQVDHILSLTDPFPDIDINVKGTAVVMEACRRHNPTARVVYTGTRGQYGKPAQLPVPETAPTMPLGIYEITNLAAEKIVEAYHLVFGVRSCLLRITNTYGPRAQMQHSRYGVVNWFIRLALDDETIPVFGNGMIQRDFLYVDDCVEALLACATNDAALGQIFNVGVDRPTTFRDLAESIVSVAGSGRWKLAPFSEERRAQEPGDFYSDISKIRSLVGWSPRTPLSAGVARTVDFYRASREHYW
ncbi:MAG: NAD-dependent epimerase/dehydratase family protein [Pirellulales bacterium]|nr:NAD-dependent epimerase/dehydratase family protein [Pirellulales bacterium]